jgi:hypothetical protein
MILKTQNTASGLNGIEHSSQHSPNPGFSDSPAQSAFDLTSEVSERYEISVLSGLLASTRAALNQDEITVAVLGRFKAGRSSFLNDFVGREVLPGGVVPCLDDQEHGSSSFRAKNRVRGLSKTLVG